jgi:hypothetical protein
MFSASPANVWVEHRVRPVGKSNYSAIRIARLVMRILFNYSSFPLRLVSGLGLVIASAAFLLGMFYLVKGIFVGSAVPGWTTVAVLLSFFNGVTIIILSMLGEYTVRLLNQTSSSESYHVRETIGRRE